MQPQPNRTIVDTVQADGTVVRTMTIVMTQIIPAPQYQKMIEQKVAQYTALAAEISDNQAIAAQVLDAVQKNKAEPAAQIA